MLESLAKGARQVPRAVQADHKQFAGVLRTRRMLPEVSSPADKLAKPPLSGHSVKKSMRASRCSRSVSSVIVPRIGRHQHGIGRARSGSSTWASVETRLRSDDSSGPEASVGKPASLRSAVHEPLALYTSARSRPDSSRYRLRDESPCDRTSSTSCSSTSEADVGRCPAQSAEPLGPGQAGIPRADTGIRARSGSRAPVGSSRSGRGSARRSETLAVLADQIQHGEHGLAVGSPQAASQLLEEDSRTLSRPQKQDRVDLGQVETLIEEIGGEQAVHVACAESSQGVRALSVSASRRTLPERDPCREDPCHVLGVSDRDAEAHARMRRTSVTLSRSSRSTLAARASLPVYSWSRPAASYAPRFHSMPVRSTSSATPK